MNLFEYLFSFRGRINRAKQWAIILVALAFEFILVIAFSAIVNFEALGRAIENKTPFATVMATSQMRTFLAVAGLLVLLIIYVDLAITTKRLHDRDKSAWWLLVFFVGPMVLNIPGMMASWAMFSHFDEMLRAAQNNLPPPDYGTQSPLVTLTNGAGLILSLWGFVELYCLPGTYGPNRYGADPLNSSGPVVADSSFQH